MSGGNGWLQRLRSGLSRSAGNLGQDFTSLFSKRRLDEAALEELEDILISADLGPAVAAEVVARLRDEKFEREVEASEIRTALADVVGEILSPVAKALNIDPGNRPHIILVVGVNGTGKTTTIGKMAKHLVEGGQKVVLAAGDTFRAAAIEQLQIWGARTGASVVARAVGSDAAAVAFEAIEQARAEDADIVLIDTAGRLQNKDHLMAELVKIRRVVQKLDDNGPHDVVLVLDATTGQNTLNQVDVFGEVAGVTGLAMTKLDGTARGGVLVAVAKRFGLPVHFIGLGENADDLQPFDAEEFARALTSMES